MTTMTDQGVMEQVQERQILKEQITKAEKRIEEINQGLAGELIVRGVQKLEAGAWRVALVDGERKALDPQGLILAGCPPSVLENPLVWKISTFTSLRVDKRT